MKYYEDNGNNIVLSVNISVYDLEEDLVTLKLIEIINKYNVSANSIKLEITEGHFLEITNNVIKNIKILKEKGVKIAIDDFGKGFSSLSYLVQLDVDYVKLDLSLINDLEI